MRDLARLRETISGWGGFERRVTSTVELFDLAIESADASMQGDLEAEAAALLS